MAFSERSAQRVILFVKSQRPWQSLFLACVAPWSRFPGFSPQWERTMVGELLTVNDLSALLKVPPSWIYQRTRSHGKDRLPHLKLGKYLRFEERAVNG
jgi:hypothetical protein